MPSEWVKESRVYLKIGKQKHSLDFVEENMGKINTKEFSDGSSIVSKDGHNSALFVDVAGD